MVRIRILSGERAGEDCRLTRFPVVIGRASDAGLSLLETGVWERHLELRLSSSREFMAAAVAEALLIVNGRACSETSLRSGDLIEIGSARLQFWLNEVGQRPLGLRETLVWLGIALVSVAQFLLIGWLLR